MTNLTNSLIQNLSPAQPGNYPVYRPVAKPTLVVGGPHIIPHAVTKRFPLHCPAFSRDDTVLQLILDCSLQTWCRLFVVHIVAQDSSHGIIVFRNKRRQLAFQRGHGGNFLRNGRPQRNEIGGSHHEPPILHAAVAVIAIAALEVAHDESALNMRRIRHHTVMPAAAGIDERYSQELFRSDLAIWRRLSRGNGKADDFLECWLPDANVI